MQTFVQIKVPGGKLLQLEKRGNHYKITGDFFCYPEDAIAQLEKILESVNSVSEKNEALELVYKNNEIVGFGIEDLLGLWEQIAF